MNKSLQQWIWLIVAAAAVGLAVGLGVWVLQSQSSNVGNATASQNSNRTATALNSNRANNQTAPLADGAKDLLTDKLSETVINLRDNDRALALQTLQEAAAIASSYEANQSEAQRREQVFTGGIKQIQAHVEQNKIDEAAAAIDDLLDRLNMPAN